jgi:hypothetical protein
MLVAGHQPGLKSQAMHHLASLIVKVDPVAQV